MNSDVIKFYKHKEYKIIKEMGYGATGVTVLLYDDSIDEYFVCKKYVPCVKKFTDEWYDRFVFEIKTLYKMYHINIVRVFQYYLYKEAKTGYILMEYINGDTIDKYLELNSSKFDDLFVQAITGFKYLESKNILHRDIRDTNIMVTIDGILKIIDFGFSKTSEEDINSISLNWIATKPNELHFDRRYDLQTEIYFLGSLFKTLKGRFSLQTKYSSIIDKMCEIDPGNRYTSFNEVYEEICHGFMNSITSNDKRIFISFANYLSNIIHSIDSNCKYVREIEIVSSKLKNVVEINCLEEYIQDVTKLINCFLNGNYKYEKHSRINMEYINEFYDWWISNSETMKDVILKAIWERLNLLDRYEDYELPF